MCCNFIKMNQQKYIMFVGLLLVDGNMIYPGFQTFPKENDVAQLSQIIEYDDP